MRVEQELVIAALAETNQSNRFAVANLGSVGFGGGTFSAEAVSEADVAETARQLPNYMVPVDIAAAGECIDGRPCRGMLGDAPAGVEQKHIGPKVAGGPLQTAYAVAELLPGYFDDHIEEVRPLSGASDRAAFVAGLLSGRGIAIGGHTTAAATETNFADGKTGCGAAEKHTDALRVLAVQTGEKQSSSAELSSQIHAMTCKLMGIAAEGQGRPDLSPTYEIDRHQADYTATGMLRVEEGRGSVEILEGTHAEVAVVVNTVPNTTVDRDEFVRRTGKQVFVVDVWYVKAIAHALVAGRPDAEKLYSQALYAGFAYQLAVYAQLCNGSHSVLQVTEAA
ncbi:hypothetical protein JNM87_04795 [Candidatus Saccharibacteria bacterium]|nr:hypothetical protein [Candidatus Saccharibacteria bacterium]